MQPFPCSVNTSPPPSTSADAQRNQVTERAYQGLTIAAMLLLVYSVWLFR